MHTVYREVSFEDMRRILDYCRRHTVQAGGLFEVYSTPGRDLHMIIVNSCSESDEMANRPLRPLGAFYCNYLRPGTITLEEEDPNFDGVESRRRHVAAVKQVVDLLIREGHPGTTIRFNDLPALNI